MSDVRASHAIGTRRTLDTFECRRRKISGFGGFNRSRWDAGGKIEGAEELKTYEFVRFAKI